MGKTCVEIAEKFDYSNSNLDGKDYIDKLFWKINNRLIEISQEYRKLVFGTIVIAVFDNGILTVTALGDSPIFYYNGVSLKRIAKNKKKYEWMIDKGYITKDQYNKYINQMHEMMWGCFDIFIPDVVPNNVIEQYEIKPNDILVMCSDGMSDWIVDEEIFEIIIDNGLEDGISELVNKAKEISLNTQNYFDDITVIAIRWY